MKNLTLEITFDLTSEEDKNALLAMYFQGEIPEIIKQHMMKDSSTKEVTQGNNTDVKEMLTQVLDLLHNGNSSTTIKQVEITPKEPVREETKIEDVAAELPQRKKSAGGLFSKKSISRA